MTAGVEIDARLREVSDSAVLLNFAEAMQTLYPRMKAIYAHCYDPYEAVVEPLFHALVYETFAGKYGVPTPQEACHTYDSVGSAYADGLHYVRVRPRTLPVEARGDGVVLELNAKSISDVELVFKSFGDGIHALTAGEVPGDPYDVSFHLTEVEVLEPSNPGRVRSQFLWLPNALVEYEFVPNAAARPTA